MHMDLVGIEWEEREGNVRVRGKSGDEISRR